MVMSFAFLSDAWFDAYDQIAADVEMPPALAQVCCNLRVRRGDGTDFEARIDGGFIRKGFAAGAGSTITSTEDLIYKAIVLGDVKSAMPAVFSGSLKIEGDKAGLVKLAMTPPTASQKRLTERVKGITNG
jgi:hypothetical protein